MIGHFRADRPAWSVGLGGLSPVLGLARCRHDPGEQRQEHGRSSPASADAAVRAPCSRRRSATAASRSSRAVCAPALARQLAEPFAKRRDQALRGDGRRLVLVDDPFAGGFQRAGERRGCFRDVLLEEGRYRTDRRGGRRSLGREGARRHWGSARSPTSGTKNRDVALPAPLNHRRWMCLRRGQVRTRVGGHLISTSRFVPQQTEQMVRSSAGQSRRAFRSSHNGQRLWAVMTFSSHALSAGA